MRLAIGDGLISHMLFADDCVLLGKARGGGVMAMKQILEEYESCFDLCINVDKSLDFFN